MASPGNTTAASTYEGPWNCERNWAKRIPTGLDGWTCFGLQRSQYVPFWCAVFALTAAYLALLRVRALWGQSRKAKAASGRQRKPANGSNGLEAGLLDGAGEEGELLLDAGEMARVCQARGAVRGLEAASLAVLLALQRRRNFGGVATGVVPKGGGKPREFEVEVEPTRTTFADLLLAVDRALLTIAKAAQSPTTSATSPESVFAWEQDVPKDFSGPGRWSVRQAAPNQLSIRGTTPLEERAFQVLFAQCAANPDGNVWELEAVPKGQLQEVLSWGSAAKDFASYRAPDSKRLVPMPDLLAKGPQNPKADAVVGDGFRLSYEELYRRADAVQHAALHTRDVKKPKAAIMYLPRGEAIGPAYLGLLQAGFTVVPVDVHWPGDRAVAVAEDSQAGLVVVETSTAAAWNRLGVTAPVLVLDAAFFQNGDSHAKTARAALDQDDPAIVLFTSGSTGKPKGIVLSHGYLTALAAGVAEWKRMSARTRTLCYHSPTWMPFLDYLFAPLLQGGCCLYFPDPGSHVVKPGELKQFGVRHAATDAGFVPAMLDILLEEVLPKTMINIGVGGAAVPADLCSRVLAALPADGALYTGYSGTEQGDVTAIRMTSAADVEHWSTSKGFMGAGRPHSGQSLVLVDEAFSPVGPGAIGEVNVAGPGLASGYLNLPDKTAETFLPELPALRSQRAARSGDLGIWTQDGNLQIVGRRDAMVKVRGARVELGEVETAVLSHPAVKAAVVTVYEDQLVAYVVPAVPADLRDHCKGRLVAYMVPHLFEGLEELPKLPNGKVNKKALPQPAARADGAETVMELDSLGQMRKFTRRAASEDRVLDNVRAILIGVVIQSHATPLLPVGAAMLDVASRPLGADWGPVQLFLLQITRGGGWSSLAFLNGFDDTRAMEPYGLTYREPLFLVLWFILDFNWTMWYLPAFVLMRASFCAAHWVGLERTHLLLASQIWILLPAFVDLYIGWQPLSPNIPVECPSMCVCPWKDWSEAQPLAYYTFGWWVAGSDPTAHSMLGHALIFIPCYWIGFYFGGTIFKLLTKVADEPSILMRILVASAVLGAYCIMYTSGQPLLEAYDDRCSAFWGAEGFIWQQVVKNATYFAMNLSMSLTYVIFIAAAVPVHLKYLAKICFSSLIFSAFTPCLLDFPSMALELRKVLPPAVSPGLELAWVFTVPFLYELVVGAFFAVALPIVARAALRVAGKLRQA